jgi:gliding motility-associated-like protein
LSYSVLKALIKILFFVSFVLSASPTYATHLIGGYMSYVYLGDAPNGNSRYRVKISVYRDCFQSDVPFDQEIPLGVYYNNEKKQLLKVEKLSLGPVSKVKPPGSDDCDYYAKNICIEYGYYEGVIEVPVYSNGYHLTFVRCCRNHQDNIPDKDGAPFQGQTYYGFIPNNSLKNSSPAFSVVPSAFICSNDTSTIVFNAVDLDGDELSYKFVHPYQGGEPTTNGSIPDPPDSLSIPIIPVYYNQDYNADYPFGTNNNSFTSIDEVTGLAKLVATEKGSYVLAVEVTEKRNGEILSVVRMDLQVLVLDCPANQVPTITASTEKQVHVEAGEELCITITGQDADNDEVELSANGIVLNGQGGFVGTKATFPVAKQVGEVNSVFCWDTDCNHARIEPYVVTFKAQDNGCPPKSRYLDLAIYVDSFVGASEITGPKNVCRYNALWYEIKGGRSESKYHWEITNGVKSSIDSTRNLLIDWEGSGTGEIRVREESRNGCLGDWIYFSVTIKESPVLTPILGKDTVCLNEQNLEYSVVQNGNNTYKWFVENATIASESSNKLVIDQYQGPNFTIKLVEYNDLGCGGDTAILNVVVSEPSPEIQGPISVCPNSINIQYFTINNYQSNYQWNVVGGTITKGNGTSGVLIDWGLEGLGNVSVTEINRHGCVSPLINLDVQKTYSLKSNPIFGDREVCEFELADYSTLKVSGSTYTWTVSGGVQILGDSSAQIKINWGPAGNSSVTVQERAFDDVNQKACLSDIIELPVIINPKPISDSIFGIEEICQTNESNLYFVRGLPNSSFTWKLNGTELIGSTYAKDSINITWENAGVFELSVAEISDKGCSSETIYKQIRVNPKPVTSPIDGAQVICAETINNQVYKVIGFNNSTFYWNIKGATSYSNSDSSEIEINWDIEATDAYITVLETSDKGCIGDTIKFPIQLDLLEIDLRFISVGYPDNHVIVDWKIDEEMNSNGFKIQKRNTLITSNWETIGTVDGNTFNISENDVNTDSSAFEYRVIATNKCGNLVSSEIHKLILLEGLKNANLDISMQFSKYEGWINGVDNYSLFESVNNANYFEKYSGIVADENFIEVSDLALYKRCYRILAQENEGELTESWSNEICVFFEPELFVPNAFTANNDRLNDAFGVKGVAINEFDLKIYNRWGELMFETKDIGERWNPVYQNKDVQSGVYMYVISYTDYNNQIYTKSGTVHLIR